MANPNYVKFQRGSIGQYNRLAVKDPNTLYFIYESTTATTGSLYLGNKLISDNVGGSDEVTLASLTDVITTSANAGDFLVLNSEGKWVATSATDVAASILEAGGNFIEIDNKEFEFNAINGQLEIKGYSSAADGLIPTKSSTGISWISMPPDLSTTVGNLQESIAASSQVISSLQDEIQAVDGKISSAIADANHLTYKVIDDLGSATATNIIYLYPNSTTSTNNLFQEYMQIDGSLELIGDTKLDLSGYASTTALNAVSNQVTNLITVTNELSSSVGNLNSKFDNYVLTSTFNSVVGDMSTINGQYNTLVEDASIADTFIDIYDRLTWQELTD